MRFAIAAALMFLVAANAQTSRGTLSGTVSDPSGAMIAGARIRLAGIATGSILCTESNESGVYRFDAVELGAYTLDVERGGFRTFRAVGIAVEANRTTSFDVRLEIGSAETSMEVNAESSDLLLKDGPLRGGDFQAEDVRHLPLILLNPVSLVRILPGATEAAGSTVTTGVANTGGFSINGQRTRANNFLLDGIDNNEVWLTGQEQVFTIADAVEEVSVQSSNFGVEFGRAGGGVVNVITKSGTNSVRGTLLWRYQSQRFDSVSNLDKLNGVPKTVFSDNIFGFTAGGPLRRNRTFFFAGFQQEDRHSTANSPLQVPTASAATRLGSLFPNNPRLDLYLGALGNVRGAGAPFNVALGADPRTGADRGTIQFATAAYAFPAVNDGPEWLARIDHQSDVRHLSWRFLYDSHVTLPMRNGSTVVSFPGFIGEQTFRHFNFAFTDSYSFGPRLTNEFRAAWARPDGRFGVIWPGSVAQAQILPALAIANVAAPGLGSIGQFHYGNNLLLQETQTRLSGRHALRYGAELFHQTITQAPAANTLGTISFNDALGYSGFANFLDDFSGPSASLTRVFGANPFHPNQFRQSYFLEDVWKATAALTITGGLRYENFGQPANSLPFPAFAGFDPSQFQVRHEVTRDNLDFGPAFGLAWSPSGRRGWRGKLFGDGKTVWRGGYQISYDALFTQLLSSGSAVSTPNALTVAITAPNIGRGAPGWFEQLPATVSPPRLTDAQNTFAGHLLNPYTERWSFGFERQVAQKILFDLSYIGSESHRLTTREDWNPRLLTGVRLHPEFGQVIVRTSEGNASYHSLQTRLERRFNHGFQLSAAYTWSRSIDSTSEAVGGAEAQGAGAGDLTSVPVWQGGLNLDRGLSDFDRRHRVTVSYLWVLPGPRSSRSRYILAGWSVAGITTFQSGTPFTVANGSDRNNDGFLEDRPDIANAAAPLNSRGIISAKCATGFQNPDTLSCVTPLDVHWVEGTGLPDAATVGRNTLYTGGTNNFDINLTKSIRLGEKSRLEFRFEALNALNHPQFIQVPPKNVNGTPAGRFLNRDFTDSGIRSMWVQAKVVF